MAGVTYSGLDELSAALNKVLDSREGLRRKYHERIADVAKDAVDRNISATVNDKKGKIRNWQERVVGSAGGYAAVRPIKGEGGKNSPGAITGYLERGHAIRRPSGTAKRARRRRVNVAYVNGRWFYRTATAEIQAQAIQVAEEYAEEIANILNGGGGHA